MYIASVSCIIVSRYVAQITWFLKRFKTLNAKTNPTFHYYTVSKVSGSLNFKSQLAWPVAAFVSLSKTLNHNCFVLRMGRKAVGPVCCVIYVKEPRTLIVKEKGLAPVFLEWQPKLFAPRNRFSVDK